MQVYVIRKRNGLMLNQDRDGWTPDVESAAGFEFFCAAEWTAIQLGVEDCNVEPADVTDPAHAAAYQRYLAEFPLNDPRD